MGMGTILRTVMATATSVPGHTPPRVPPWTRWASACRPPPPRRPRTPSWSPGASSKELGWMLGEWAVSRSGWLSWLTGPTFQGRQRRDSLTAWVVIRWIVSFTYFKVARLIPLNYGARRPRVRYFVFALQILQLLRPQHQVRLEQNQSNIRAGEMANFKWRNRLHWGRDDALCCTSTAGKNSLHSNYKMNNQQLTAVRGTISHTI